MELSQFNMLGLTVDEHFHEREKNTRSTMLRLVVYCMLSLLLVEQTVAEECQQEAQQGCKVDDGHAQCESWNISASIHSLPPCITSLIFSLIKDPHYLRQYDYIELNEINFNQFKNLEELELNTNHGNYSHIFLVQDSKSLVSLKKISILRFRVMHYYNIELNKRNHNMYSNLRYLKILDLSRAKISVWMVQSMSLVLRLL